MNAAAIKNSHAVQEKGSTERFISWFILVCIFWVLAVSNQSLWLDEAHGAGWKANQKTLAEFWNDDVAQKGSTDSQILFYVFYIWVWAKAFGTNEWVLRAANLPWIVLGAWIWFNSFTKRNPLKWSVPIVAACSPFLWYYLNEARPYAMQIGSSFLILGALHQLYKAESGRFEKWNVAAFCFGLVVLSGSNLLGQLWAGAAIATAFFVFGWSRTKLIAKKNLFLCASASIVLVAMGIFYLWTLKSGSRSTSVGRTDAKNFFYIVYELFGFNGLGPGRLDIRDNGLRAFRAYATRLFLYAIFLAPIFFAGVKEIIRSVPKRVLGFTVLFFGGVSAFFAFIGMTSQFRILGRHFSPLLAFVICILAFGIAKLWQANRLGKVCVMGFVAVSFVSCLSLRFASWHEKDDYRSAAMVARNALQDGKTVWWNANERAAGYYRVATSTNDIGGSARILANPSEVEIQNAAPPDVVLVSKPDVYDAGGVVSKYLRVHNFQSVTNFNAFTIWQKLPEQ